jgi:hypothetical protein
VGESALVLGSFQRWAFGQGFVLPTTTKMMTLERDLAVFRATYTHNAMIGCLNHFT